LILVLWYICYQRKKALSGEKKDSLLNDDAYAYEYMHHDLRQ